MYKWCEKIIREAEGEGRWITTHSGQRIFIGGDGRPSSKDPMSIKISLKKIGADKLIRKGELLVATKKIMPDEKISDLKRGHIQLANNIKVAYPNAKILNKEVNSGPGGGNYEVRFKLE